MMDVLCPDEGWAFGWVRLNLTATVNCHTAYVTVPPEIVRLIVTAVCKHPVHIRNQFWEFMEFGPGMQPKACCNSGCGASLSAYERDNAVTLTDLTGTSTVRIYPTDVRDSGLRVLVQGKDQNDLTILTTDPVTGLSAPGEYIVLQFPFVDSVNQFSKISGIQKDQNYGVVQFFQISPTTGAELPLSSMEPNDSTAWYRRYMVSGIPTTNLCCASPSNPVHIEAEGRLDFRPVQNETDYLSLPCIPALLEECQAIRFARMDGGMNNATAHHARAIAYLNGQLDALYGKTSVAVRVPLFGSARLRRQPV
jgi:hypothetical protein